ASVTLPEVGTHDAALVMPELLEEAAKRFEILSDRDMLEQFAQPVTMLIEDLVEMRAVAMLSGSWGTGKTALLMAIGIAVSTGSPLAGRFPVTKSGRVLFIGAERSPRQYWKQYAKLLRGLGLRE